MNSAWAMGSTPIILRAIVLRNRFRSPTESSIHIYQAQSKQTLKTKAGHKSLSPSTADTRFQAPILEEDLIETSRTTSKHGRHIA